MGFGSEMLHMLHFLLMSTFENEIEEFPRSTEEIGGFACTGACLGTLLCTEAGLETLLWTGAGLLTLA